MPRKTRAKAEQETRAADFNRWRLLVRNPAFLKDLLALRELGVRAQHRPELVGRSLQAQTQVADKWGLLRIPPDAIFIPNPATLAFDDEPQWLESCYRQQGDKQGPYPVDYSPVALTKLKEGRFLFLRVDTTKPVDVILPGVEALLRGFYKIKPAKRGRPQSLDFQLKVLDLVQKDGKDFRAVARQLGKPVSTVRSAYVAVCRKVGVLGAPAGRPRGPVKNPGPIRKCRDPRCRAAQRPEDFCAAHQAWTEQDQVSQREWLRRDPSRD